MNRWMMPAAVVGSLVLTGAAWAAKAPRAPSAQCKLFKKTSDGRWYSTIDSKVGNPKDFKVLKAGLPIPRDMTIVGINVSGTIDRLCGGR